MTRRSAFTALCWRALTAPSDFPITRATSAGSIDPRKPEAASLTGESIDDTGLVLGTQCETGP